MLFPPAPAARADISTSAEPGAAALTPTTEPHPVMFIRFARFIALLFNVLVSLRKVTVLVPELNVHDADVEDPAVRISVFVRPVIVRVLFEAGVWEKVLDAPAVAGGLAVNVTPSTVRVELPLMLDELEGANDARDGRRRSAAAQIDAPVLGYFCLLVLRRLRGRWIWRQVISGQYLCPRRCVRLGRLANSGNIGSRRPLRRQSPA